VSDEQRDDGLRREFGLTRRDLMKRGAIVGGTLLWAAPVIQSITAPSAYAASLHACCQCARKNDTGVKCAQDDISPSECAAQCSTPVSKKGKPLNSVVAYHTGKSCSCVKNVCSCT